MNRYSIVTEHVEGFSVCTMEDRQLHAIARLVPQIGNNLFSFCIDGEPVILQPPDLGKLNDAPFWYGTPILFPPNRVSHARFTVLGQQYHLPKNAQGIHMHGEIGKKPWRVTDYGASDEKGAYVRTEFRFDEHEDMMSYFPHELVFTITYVLKDGSVHLTGEVLNAGSKAAPYALGFHPYFRLEPRSVAANAVRLQLSAEKEWPVTTEGFVEENPSETGLCNKIRESARLSDIPQKGYSFFSVPQQSNRCEITDELQKTSVIFETDEHFPFMVVFRPSWAPGLSLEPYTCVTDCFNLQSPMEMSGARAIETGQTYRFRWSLRRECMPE